MKRVLLAFLLAILTACAAAQQDVGTLSLRSLYGPFVQEGNPATAVASDVGDRESFKVRSYTNATLMSGDQIDLQSLRSGLYVSSRFDMDGTPILVNVPWSGAWERFWIYRTAGAGQIKTGDEIYLKASNGYTVSTRFDLGGNPLSASVPWVGAWELFRAQLMPPGFQLKEWTNGARVYQRNLSSSLTEYVTFVDLTRASLKSYQGGTDSDNSVQRRAVAYYADRAGQPFAMINGTYFENLLYWKTKLSYGLKSDFQTVATGVIDQPAARAFCFGGTSANIRMSLSEAMADPGTSDVVGILDYNQTSEQDPSEEGRTMLGLVDAFGEGRKQAMMIYSCRSRVKSDAAKILRDFGATDLGQLDGGGSTWLRVFGTDYIPTGRDLPHVIAIYGAGY